MTHPKPSLFQCLVLHQVFDGMVRFEHGRWMMRESYLERDVTFQVGKLIADGYVTALRHQNTLALNMTQQGHEVLERRPLLELIEQRNRKVRDG